MGNAVARVSPDPLDRPRITRSTSDGLARILSDKLHPHSESPRPHSIPLPRPRTFARAPARPSDKLRPLSPALGSPTPLQPFPNTDMDGINRHPTTTQPSFVSNPRTARFRHNHPPSKLRILFAPSRKLRFGLKQRGRWPKLKRNSSARFPISGSRGTCQHASASGDEHRHLIPCLSRSIVTPSSTR